MGDASTRAAIGYMSPAGAPGSQIEDRCPGGFHDLSWISQDVALPEPQYVEAERLQPFRALGIVVGLFDVLTAVDLHDESFAQAREIGDVAVDRHLPAKPQLTRSATTQRPPKRRLRFGRCPT